MIPIPCFMVELVNPHTRTYMAKVYCGLGPDCQREHADDDGHRWHPPEEEQTDTVQDVRRLDTGEIVATDVYGLAMCGVPGAMFWWDIHDQQADDHVAGSRYFVSGPQLTVILPDFHPWTIDGRASNCGKPADFEHRCWIRHGEPPAITVDKQGLTCEAGAGSIQTGSWHGYLRDGQLVE
jgi:hypothetical protein